MKKYIIFLFICLLPAWVFSQARKPEVLVYGDGVDAFAAALQSAKSNLHTVWVVPAPNLRSSMDLKQGAITRSDGLDAGIWADVLAGAMGSQSPTDSLLRRAKNPINGQLILNSMDSMIRQYPHLHIHFHDGIRSANKRRQWQIRLQSGHSMQVRAVIDASLEGEIASLAKLAPISFRQEDLSYLGQIPEPMLARTGVAVSDVNRSNAYSIALSTLLPQGEDNLFYTRNDPRIQTLLTGTMEDLPLLAHVGQAVGAAAAYVAFFKTTTDKIEVRQVQGELLQYGARLMPYQDILSEDPHLPAIQRVGATNLFTAAIDSSGRYGFMPDKQVSTKELEPVLNQLYSRSQIWFMDHQHDAMTLEDLLSLIKYIGQRGNELEGQVEKEWSRKLNFPGEFDLQMPINRRHAAVLLDTYCQPFDVRVDLDGRVTR